MFRRARFSVKPNVRPSATGRGNSGSSVGSAAAPPDPGAQHGLAPTAYSSVAAVGSPTIQPGAVAGDLQQSGDSTSNNSSDEKTNDERGDGDCSKCTETVLQRRKRISTMPNLAKPRVVSPSTQRVVSSVSKGSQKQIPHSPLFGNSLLQKELPSSEKIHVDISPKSPILPEKKTPVPQIPQFSPFKKSASKEPNSCVTGQRNDEGLQKNTYSPLKERPTQEILIQEEITQSKSSPTKEKTICSDREKIIKTQKLRKMLKEELKKEKEQRKYKCPVIEKPVPEDRSKMIMRDFIYYLPENNPMKSSLVEEKKTEKTSTVTQAKEPEERIVADLDDENEEDEEEDGGGVEDDGPLLVPRVKVAEDGSIILDEESLTVEVLRTKGQCVVEENDPIFERGSTTTYSSFRKSYYTKPWSEKETDMFFLAISMVGTDFSMISQLFPHRARTEIKNKFKREEKANGWRIDKAFKEKRPFDFDFFAKLLEKILENERRKKEKDAKCQRQKERNPNEKKAPKIQKKRKAKVVNGQTNHGQDDFQNAGMSDAEMEVDAGTAEKENEESPSILEQVEGQAVTESIVTKKKRKRKKKDSEYEAENLPEERIIPAEMVEKETSRKKRKSTSSSVEINGTGEVGDELEDPDGATPDETILLVEEDPQCCIQFNEEAGGYSSSTLSSTQDNVFIDAESGELDVPEASSVHHVGQPSNSQMSLNTDKDGFDGTDAAKSKVAELDKLDENQNMLPPSHDDDIMETDRSATEKPTMEGRLQRLTSDVASASEKREPLVSDPSAIKSSPSEPMDGAEKTNVGDKTADITEPITEETSRTNNGMERESPGTQKPLAEKIGRRQRPKPNIVKVSSRKEAPAHGKPDKPEPDGTVEKDDAASVTTEESAEKDSQFLTTESLTCKKSTSQESSKHTVLKPALLTRGRMQRPKPNLERIARRQKEPARNTEAEEEKAAIEAEKPLREPECNSRELLSKDTSEVTTYEADMPHSEALENKAVASAVKESSKYTSESPVKKPLECKSHNPPTTSLSSNNVEDAADFATRDFSLQQEQKDISAETEHSLKSYSPSLKDNIGKVLEREETVRAEEEMIGNKNETETAEKSLVNITSECSKSFNLDEAAKCGILAFSLLLEEPLADAQEAVAKIKTHLSPQNLSGFKSDEPKEVLLSPDIEKKKSVGKQSSQEESKQSAIRPTPLLRGRFQRPKPNIRRAVGRKEMQAVETNEAATAVVGNVKSELKKSEPSRTPPMVTQLKCDSKVLPVESLEKKLADTEKVIQEDSQVPRTSQNISEQFSRRKPISQEDTPCTIKPAQLVRGRFQRARPNLGRASGKKEEPVTEDVSAAVEGEVGKMKIGVIKKDNLNPPSKDEVSVQAPLGNLEKKGSGSSNAPSPKRCIDQKKHSSSEKSQGCELLKDQEETCVSKDDDEGKHWDIPGSDISASQEIRQSKSIKPTQHTRGHLQKPKPNLARAAKKKDAALEGEASAEGKTERATRNDATLHGNKSGKISTVMHPRNLTEAASSSGSLRLKKSTDSIGTGSLTRSKDSGKCDSSELSSGSERQIQKEISKPPSAQERAPETLKGKQPGRTLKQKKNICDSRTVLTLECENVHSEKRKHHQKVKPTVSRGRRLRPALHKKPRKEYGSSKVNLVTLRASSQEEDDVGDDDDFEPDYEVECFSPEEVNKAPVFVPKGLRSPNPIPVQIEETMEELEIYENVADEPCLPHELSVAGQTVIQGDKELYSLQDVITQEEQNKETGISDGSTEAAMTLLAMRDPVFQLNISNQEKIQEFPSKDELNIPDSFPDEHNEEQSIVDCNVACSALSKHELVSSDNMNKAATEDHSNELLGLEEYFQETTNVSWPASSKNELASSHSANEGAPEYHNSPFLEECSQETTRVGSDLSFFKGSKTSRIASCSFPKPKPNLNRGLGLNRNAPQKSLGLSSGVEQTNAIQNEEKVSESAVEEQKVELEQNFKLNKLAKSNSAEKQDLQPGNAGPAIQTNDMERENLVRETWELNAQKLSQEAETCPTESANDPNANSNVQASGPIECLQLSTVEVAQTEASKFSSISATAEMTAVSSGSSREYPDVEEEPTFILTLVEISADLADCSVVPPSLQQTSEELLPAPVFLTPDNIDSVELTSAQSIGSITAVVPDNTRERGGLQVASAKHLADLGSTSRKSLKRCAAAFEGSGDPPEKKKPLSTGENLESFDKETSVKLKCIPRKAAGTPTEKLNISKKKISSTSRPVTETAELQMEEREQLQSSLNLGAKLFDEAASTSEKVSRTLYAGKAEPSEKKRNFVHTCKSVQSEQVGSMVVLPKTPLSRSLGFLPLICKNNNTDEEVATKRNEQSLQKTHKVVSENTVECPTLFSRDNSEESQEDNSFPLTISSPSKSENGGFSTIRVFSELSEHEGTSKEQEKEEEPTRISEYFFSDIFMEVDDSE